jgi:hypothetical protein
MLFTNFSQGELSEDLFGRVDLQQYFQGAARVENFDVIPTGGIEKRRGSRRLAKLDGDGRIIPFIITRDEAYLLFIQPGKMRIYQIKAGILTLLSTQENQLAEDGYVVDNYKTPQINGWTITAAAVKAGGRGYKNGEYVYLYNTQNNLAAIFSVSVAGKVETLTPASPYVDGAIDEEAALSGGSGYGCAAHITTEPVWRVDAVTIDAGGQDYAVNDIVSLAGAEYRVTAVTSDASGATVINGIVSEIEERQPLDYTADPAASGGSATGGSGTGLTLTVTSTAKIRVKSANISNPGSGYTDGDILRFVSTSHITVDFTASVMGTVESVTISQNQYFSLDIAGVQTPTGGSGTGLTLSLESERQVNSTLFDGHITPREGDQALVQYDETSGFSNVYYEYKDGQWQLMTTLTLWTSMDAILRIQYVQDFRRLYLTERSQRPKTLSISEDGVISIADIILNRTMEDVNNEESSGETDAKTYGQLFPPAQDDEVEAGLFQDAGLFPAAVTKFNGRVIFGGTDDFPQRVWASAPIDTDGAMKFATAKRFIMRSRQYHAMTGEASPEGYGYIIPDETEAITALKNLGSRIVLERNAFFYDDNTSEVLVTSVIDGRINLSGLRKTGQGLTEAEEKELNATLNDPQNGYQAKLDEVHHLHHDNDLSVNIYYSAFRIDIHIDEHGGPFQHSHQYDYGTPISQDPNLDLKTALYDWMIGNSYYWYPGMHEQAYRDIVRIRSTYMQYTFGGKVYRGMPATIESDIKNAYNYTDTPVFTFYADSYQVENTATADCGFTFEIGSDLNDRIQWITNKRNLIIGTENTEWMLNQDIDALNYQAYPNSRYGSADIQANTIGEAVIFFQYSKKAIVEYFIGQQDNYFRANDMAMMSKNMLRESQVRDFDFVSTPYTRILIVREDGAVMSLLYDRGLGVYAWTRITTAGRVRNLATAPSASGFDVIYLITERGGEYFLEVLDDTLEVYLDSYKEWDGNAADYGAGAVVLDAASGTVYPVASAPPPAAGQTMWVGYPFHAALKTLPILANTEMKKQRITALIFRFLRSYLPSVGSWAGGQLIKTDRITNKPEPFSGVHQIPFPGTWDADNQAELLHDAPFPVRILAINAEVQ